MASGAHVAVVREEVQRLLDRAPAYRGLAPEARDAMLEHMVAIGSYLADPSAHREAPSAAAPTDAVLADPINALKQRLADKPGAVSPEFKASAVQQATEDFGALVQKVDFPAFVSGLVKGVFQAVVDASIQQMQAYGELLSASAKSVQQFADDHISDAQVRDQIASRFPSKFTIDTSGDGPAKLAPRDPNGDIDLGGAYGTDSSVDISDPDSEQALVNQAKLEMARSRQQTMATMVLMGINRIVVTNGQINAKVLFDVSANDQAARHAKAELHDATSDSTTAFGGGSFGGLFGGGFLSSTSHTTSVQSAIDDTSEAKAQMKAQLSGDVHLAFKSDVFPLEKMVDVMGMQTLNDRAAPLPIGPRATPLPAPAAAGPAPAAAGPAPAGAGPAPAAK
jgi:hypothetical protein